jgi:hypothetical protein
MNRRDFIATGLVSGATAVVASNVARAGASGMERGLKDNKTKEGETACIQAYVSCDNFGIDVQ